MRALVVYESMFGNTRLVAEAVAEGLSSGLDVDVVEVAAAPTSFDDVELVVVGGPTHALGMTRQRTRDDARRQGEQSGHVQRVREIRLDCDRDSILLIVEQVGGVACHTGRERCFYRRLDGDQWQAIEPILEDPVTVYGRE